MNRYVVIVALGSVFAGACEGIVDESEGGATAGSGSVTIVFVDDELPCALQEFERRELVVAEYRHLLWPTYDAIRTSNLETWLGNRAYTSTVEDVIRQIHADDTALTEGWMRKDVGVAHFDIITADITNITQQLIETIGFSEVYRLDLTPYIFTAVGDADKARRDAIDSGLMSYIYDASETGLGQMTAEEASAFETAKSNVPPPTCSL